MVGNLPRKIKSIRELLQLRGLPDTRHALISVINIASLQIPPERLDRAVITDFYFIGMSNSTQSCVKMKNVHEGYDFDKGVMNFIAPGRVFSFNADQVEGVNPSGWLLLLHPDFLWRHPLALKMKQYEFFDYTVNEALFLSDQEEQMINNLFKSIEQEYLTHFDKFSQEIIIPFIEALLGYAARFYQRQFMTRKIPHHTILNQLKALLEKSFSQEMLAAKGIPTVKEISSELHISPNYLSSLLKTLTGNSTQQHIQEKIIEKAKEKLITTNLSVNEIAFELGFEYSQSFSKLFKMKTQISPREFRRVGRL